MAYNPSSRSCSYDSFCFLFITFVLPFFFLTKAQAASHCRTSCGTIPINYPFGIDDGCGSPYYRHMLLCSDSGILELRTPSGRYQVRSISYSDPHMIVTDPFMWKCKDGHHFRATRAFSLDTSTHLTLSSQNDYLFFNCSEEKVIVEPKPIFCERFPDRCDSTCDSASYLCRHLPGCGAALGGRSCCSYFPKATESLRLMLKYCASYTSIYWRINGANTPDDHVPEYGIRVDFDIPVTPDCLQCQDMKKGGGRCGFDTQSQNFLCLCNQRSNVTTYCNGMLVSKPFHPTISKPNVINQKLFWFCFTDHSSSSHSKAGIIAGEALKFHLWFQNFLGIFQTLY